MPSPPSRAIAMAMRAPVTRSIGELSTGAFSQIPRAISVLKSTSAGRTALSPGTRRTSSKLSPSRIFTSVSCISPIPIPIGSSNTARLVENYTFFPTLFSIGVSLRKVMGWGGKKVENKQERQACYQHVLKANAAPAKRQTCQQIEGIQEPRNEGCEVVGVFQPEQGRGAEMDYVGHTQRQTQR